MPTSSKAEARIVPVFRKLSNLTDGEFLQEILYTARIMAFPSLLTINVSKLDKRILDTHKTEDCKDAEDLYSDLEGHIILLI